MIIRATQRTHTNTYIYIDDVLDFTTMDITRINTEKRMEIIKGLVRSLNASMDSSTNNELTFDFESIIIAVQADSYCSRRTAMEYANIALYKIGLKRADLADAPNTNKTQKTLKLLE